MEIKEFIENLAEQFEETDPALINENTNFQDLEEWGSLTTMFIIAMVKTKYGKTITGAEIKKCATVTELYDLIKNL